jgi:hypothetical protein
MRLVRKNQILISGTFSLPGADGVPALVQPSSATLILSYTNTQEKVVMTTIAMTYDAGTETWSGVWDSSDCKVGRVDWLVYSSGALVAADEGSFHIYANDANTV